MPWRTLTPSSSLLRAFAVRACSECSTDTAGKRPPSGAARISPACVRYPCSQRSWSRSRSVQCLLNALRENRSGRVVDALEHAFHDADEQLEQMWAESDGEKDSGSTAVVAFLRLEEEDGEQSFAPSKQPLSKVLPRAPRTHDGNAGRSSSKDLNSMNSFLTPLRSSGPQRGCHAAFRCRKGALLCQRRGRARSPLPWRESCSPDIRPQSI